MTISSSTNRASFSGNGSTTAFATGFKFFAAADLLVVLSVDATGVETTQVLDTDYTITGAGEDAGGTVTMVTAPASGETLTIVRGLSYIQELDLVENDELPSESVEQQFDKLVMMTQQLDEINDRTLKFPVSSALSGIEMPATLTASAVIAVNSAGDALENGPTTTQITNAETNATAAAASATASATSAAASATSATASAASATAAAASATAAAASAASNMFATVVNKNNADSPYTVVADTDDGTMFLCDMSSGNLTMTLPSIATAGEGERYGFLRVGASNTLTLARDGTDTINGVAGDYTVTANDGELVVLVADDASPDNWVTLVWTQAVADESTLTKTGSTLSIASGGVDTTQLADDGVTPAKVQGSVNAQTGTSYTPVLGDAYKLITMTNASANTVTIPTNASVAFATGDLLEIAMLGAGVTTITGDTGVTINGVSAGSLALEQYGGASLRKIGTDTWYLVGGAVA